ncbi:MAG: homocysteine S-methyltransferase family protein, partial [Planctomycetales bacterium]|nr:homocysteine S-methyltransferase family protein [Planctomycetales bacterium]
MPTASTSKSESLSELLSRKILVIDGAMGTMVQALGLTEADKRGERFADHSKDLGNLTDLLCLTRPDDVTNIHRAYLEAGANLIETNSFN